MTKPVSLDAALAIALESGLDEGTAALIDAASEPHGMQPDRIAAGAVIVDVRRAMAWDAASDMIAGARRGDPASTDWHAMLPRGMPVVVYCVFGHRVSRATALKLRGAGIDAWFLRGGIEAWRAAGRALEARRGES